MSYESFKYIVFIFGCSTIKYNSFDLCIFVIKMNLLSMKVDFLDVKRVNDSFQPELSKTVDRVVRSGWYLLGEETKCFEREFSHFIGTKYCVGVGNGLDALTIVLSVWKSLYNWSDGDEVIVPANTFIATALAVSKSGLKPIFCDVCEDTALINADLLKDCISERTKAVIPVHLYGRVCDMDKILQVSKVHGLYVLEDACQAHGAIFHSCNSDSLLCGRCAGNLGHAAAFSFYPGKNLGALGDGGCVTTNDSLLAEMVRNFSNYGQVCKYVHDFKGVNSRLDELQAAVLRLKLQRLDEDNDIRRLIAETYYNGINNPLIKLLKMEKDVGSHVYHVFVIRCEDRNRLQKYLNEKGISTLIHYPCCPHRQKAYKEFVGEQYPVAEKLESEVLSIPISPVMLEEEVDFVIDALNTFV